MKPFTMLVAHVGIENSGLFARRTSHHATVRRMQGKKEFQERYTGKYNKSVRTKGLFLVTEARPKLKKLRGELYTVSYTQASSGQIRKTMTLVGA